MNEATKKTLLKGTIACIAAAVIIMVMTAFSNPSDPNIPSIPNTPAVPEPNDIVISKSPDDAADLNSFSASKRVLDNPQEASKQ
jgi:hypothetical protein